jgi:hypothetical protein
MAFKLKRRESVEQGVRRIAREQIDSALHELHSEALPRDETIHQVRKRCKKLRGLLRLVRPCLESTYQTENARFRDAARMLSAVRDAQTMIDTYDALLDHFAKQVDRRSFAPFRRELSLRRQRLEAQNDLEQRLRDFEATMRIARDRVAGWEIGADGVDAWRGGLIKTYRRARKAMAAAADAPAAENLHEWRKRVKYHWYHLRLLHKAWPPMLTVQRDAADRLGGLLGDDHDLHVLRQALDGPLADLGDAASREALRALIDRRRLQLQGAAQLLGGRLLAERPQALADRLGRYWLLWQDKKKVRRRIRERAAALH